MRRDDGAAQPGHLRALAPGPHAAGPVDPGRASQQGAAARAHRRRADRGPLAAVLLRLEQSLARRDDGPSRRLALAECARQRRAAGRPAAGRLRGRPPGRRRVAAQSSRRRAARAHRRWNDHRGGRQRRDRHGAPSTLRGRDLRAGASSGAGCVHSVGGSRCRAWPPYCSDPRSSRASRCSARRSSAASTCTCACR